MGGPEVTQPKQFGSRRSPFILVLLHDQTHRTECASNRDEWETVVTWVDANAPYFASFYQYFDFHDQLLPHAIRVRVELDRPFQRGEKSYRMVAADAVDSRSKLITLHD